MLRFGRRLAGAVVGGAVFAAASLSASAQDRGTIVYLIPTLIDEFQTTSQEAVEFVFGELGFDVVSLDAQNRGDLQLNQMEDALALGPKAFILAAVDFDAVTPGVDAAKAAGVPVIVFDRQVRSTDFALTSVSGNVDIGRIAGAEIKRLLEERNGSPSGKVLQILGDPGDNYSLDIQSGFEEVMADLPDIELITDAALNWEPSNAADIAENELLANPDIDLIFSHAAHLSDAVRAVLEAAGKSPGDIMMVSSNGAPVGLEMIREGWIQVEVEQPLFAQVWGMAKFIDLIEAGATIEPGSYDVLGLEGTLTVEDWGPNLALPGAAITADNVEESRFWGNLETPDSPPDPLPVN
ncbi:MAG: sugar ABC transporter substrate-binding protein [Alphaproteobacteria bacterium]